jgi:hypothetical protein
LKVFSTWKNGQPDGALAGSSAAAKTLIKQGQISSTAANSAVACCCHGRRCRTEVSTAQWSVLLQYPVSSGTMLKKYLRQKEPDASGRIARRSGALATSS